MVNVPDLADLPGVYTVISTGLYFSTERSFRRNKSRRNPDEKHSLSPKVIIPQPCAGTLEQCGRCMGQTALQALVCPEVENIRTLQSHEFWEGSYQNQHPALAFLLSLMSSYPFSLSFARPLLSISSISHSLSSPFPCSRLFPNNLSSPNVYLPSLGPLLQLLPGRRFLLH